MMYQLFLNKKRKENKIRITSLAINIIFHTCWQLYLLPVELLVENEETFAWNYVQCGNAICVFYIIFPLKKILTQIFFNYDKKHIKIITLFLFKYMIKDIFFKIKN